MQKILTIILVLACLATCPRHQPLFNNPRPLVVRKIDLLKGSPSEKWEAVQQETRDANTRRAAEDAERTKLRMEMEEKKRQREEEILFEEDFVFDKHTFIACGITVVVVVVFVVLFLIVSNTDP